jgi:hypothetical protein
VPEHAYIKAQGNRSTGWVRLQFGFNKATSDLVKSLPGAKWGPMQGVPEPWASLSPVLHKAWFVPTHSWAVLEKLVPSSTTWAPDRTAEIPEVFLTKGRDYQIASIQDLIRHRAFFLLFDMRVGKTFTALGAAAAMLGAGHADAVLILYPAQVGLEWEKQAEQWAGVALNRLEGKATIADFEVERLRAEPYLFLGCHYEILAEQEESIARVLDGKRVIVIADECQQLQNRRVARGKSAIRLSRGASWKVRAPLVEECQSAAFQITSWWPLSGTPMRNKPKNLWLPFELALPGSMGGDLKLNKRGTIEGYWNYGKRYCAAFEDERGHWNDKGVSNPDELRARLASVSVRKTRADVAAHLPPSERRIIYCEAPRGAMDRYEAIESKHAGLIRSVVRSDGEFGGRAQVVLEALARETSSIKIPKAAERVEFHLDRGAKVVAFGHFKDTVEKLGAALREALGEGGAIFDAGTHQNLSPDDRKRVIESWTAHEGPAVLCANSLASGVGIDMSAAEVAVHLELEWVPADLRQREARLDDIHKGTRKVPAVHEYLLLKETIDEPMAAILIEKIRALEAIVGKDAETQGLGGILRDSGLVNTDSLGLESTNKEAIGAALAHLRERLMRGAVGKSAGAATVIAEVAELEEDEDD